MADRQKSTADYDDDHFRPARRKQHLRRSKGDRPSTGRRTLKQAFRDYRAKRKSAGSPVEGHYSIRRWKNRSRRVVKNPDGEATFHQTAKEEPSQVLPGICQVSQPILPPKIHYREQASTESLLLEAEEPMPRLGEPRFVPLLFDQPAAGTSRSKSAPVNSLEGRIELASFHVASLPREFPPAQAETELFPLNNGGHRQQIQVTDVTTTSISRTASTVSTKLTTEPKAGTDSAGNGVMKRLGASFSSFFSFAIPKKVSSQHIYDSGENSRGLSSPFFKSKHSIEKGFTPPRGSIDYVDYSIYGNHAKYFI
ncbi:hypothetical protein HG536_0G00380 [Torulaspora globosa]|uniref:Uncharacterized protein n=1 Tax=Torulaspora globosa TaxID=48254 RepID=A0A7G3ZKZ5_9SACH|nr:uncharacterized protein HG536_0G00380 [Torulaspora globosa]QLL34181.1 hypothetical protein HG536_0G00380 [Torulaspora globosa]